MASEVFAAGGVANDVYLDRPGQGKMKLLVTVKQTAGNPGDTYFVNLSCLGVAAPPKVVLLQDG